MALTVPSSHILGPGGFLLDVQSHKLSSDPELVEDGQRLAMFVDPAIGHAADDADDENDDEDEG